MCPFQKLIQISLHVFFNIVSSLLSSFHYCFSVFGWLWINKVMPLKTCWVLVISEVVHVWQAFPKAFSYQAGFGEIKLSQPWFSVVAVYTMSTQVIWNRRNLQQLLPLAWWTSQVDNLTWNKPEGFRSLSLISSGDYGYGHGKFVFRKKLASLKQRWLLAFKSVLIN